MIKTIAEDTYSVGTYTVKLVANKWEVTGGNLKGTALFDNRWDALATANLRYTCGQLVSEGVRDILEIMIADEPA